MSARCCRDTPRCADCPVLVAAAARRRQRTGAGVASLVEDVLVGSPPRELPAAVVAALVTLDAARTRRAPVLAAEFAR